MSDKGFFTVWQSFGCGCSALLVNIMTARVLQRM